MWSRSVLGSEVLVLSQPVTLRHSAVDSEIVDDTYAEHLADEITSQIEQGLEYPGQLRICLVREVRAVHYAR